MAANDLIKVWVLVSFYDENGLHKAGSVAYVKEEEFNPNYMKKIEGGGGGSVIDNIQLTDQDQVDSMDIDGNSYYFSTVGQVGINSDGKVTSVVLNDTEQEFTSIDNIQVDSEYCTKSFDLNGDTVSFVSIENIEEDSEYKVKQFDLNGATKEFTSIENISTQGPNGEVDSMDINGNSYKFATGGATELNNLDDVNINYVYPLDRYDILSFDPYRGANGEWINVHSDGYKIYCEGNDAPINFSKNSQLSNVLFERSGVSLTPQDIDRAITRVATYGAAICLTYVYMNNYYTYAFKCIDKDKNLIFESEIFDNNGKKYVSQIVFSVDSHSLDAIGNTFALSSGGGGGGGSALVVNLSGLTDAIQGLQIGVPKQVTASESAADILAADEVVFVYNDTIGLRNYRWIPTSKTVATYGPTVYLTAVEFGNPRVGFLAIEIQNNIVSLCRYT